MCCRALAQQHIPFTWYIALHKQCSAAKENEDKVNYPNECCTGKNGKYAEDGEKQVFVCQTLADPCNTPDDIDCGDAEDDFDNERQTVQFINQLFHDGMCSLIEMFKLYYNT